MFYNNCQGVVIVPGRRAEFSLKVNSKHGFLSETETKHSPWSFPLPPHPPSKTPPPHPPFKTTKKNQD